MRKRIWWGGAAGGMAGLAMLACALVLANHGQRGCLRPFEALALPMRARGHAATDLEALAGGTLFHEGVAIVLGMVGMRLLMPRALVLAAALWPAGGVLSMELVDRGVLAWRAPEMPVMLTGVQVLPYLVFGATLAAMILGPLFIARPANGGAVLAPMHAASAAMRPGTVLHRPVLQVLIVPHCFGCERARQLAAEAQSRFPGLTVRVVDLEQSRAPLPTGVVAVPAYVLDGRLLFTGNPTAEALHQALTEAIAAIAMP
jgi:hypothetical protein